MLKVSNKVDIIHHAVICKSKKKNSNITKKCYLVEWYNFFYLPIFYKSYFCSFAV